MEAKLFQDGEILIVHLKGRVDYDTVESFRKTCDNHLFRHKVVFDLSALTFVGSIGITDFVDAVISLNLKSQQGVKFSSVSSEFRRIFQAREIQNLELYEDSEKAKLAFLGYDIPKIQLQPIVDVDFLENEQSTGITPEPTQESDESLLKPD